MTVCKWCGLEIELVGLAWMSLQPSPRNYKLFCEATSGDSQPPGIHQPLIESVEDILADLRAIEAALR